MRSPDAAAGLDEARRTPTCRGLRVSGPGSLPCVNALRDPACTSRTSALYFWVGPPRRRTFPHPHPGQK